MYFSMVYVLSSHIYWHSNFHYHTFFGLLHLHYVRLSDLNYMICVNAEISGQFRLFVLGW